MTYISEMLKWLIRLLRSPGGRMDANGIVKVRFSGAHFDSDGVSLRDFARVGAQIVKSNHAVVFRSIAYQLVLVKDQAVIVSSNLTIEIR